MAACEAFKDGELEVYYSPFHNNKVPFDASRQPTYEENCVINLIFNDK